jgi:tryptophanyl-tRNA synthetase
VAKRVFSGIQPTGTLHIGNYLGAIRNWVDLQQNHDCIYCVVDYHALTIDVDPKELRSASRSMALDLLACGVDPERSITCSSGRRSATRTRLDPQLRHVVRRSRAHDAVQGQVGGWGVRDRRPVRTVLQAPTSMYKAKVSRWERSGAAP